MDKTLPFLWGAQYYRAPTPDPECWEADLAAMQDLGFNAVKFWAQWRWSHHAPKAYEWSDLDRLMDLAAGHDLAVTINTIFDVAPFWIYETYPDAKQLLCDGTIVEPTATAFRQIGGFPGPCYNHPGARRERERFMQTLLTRYADHPALSMVDVWNEPEQCGPYRKPEMAKLSCYCPHCKTAYAAWLSNKYGSIDDVNRVHGKCYRSFQDIELPRNLQASFTESVDWREFHLDTMTAEAKWRLAMVKRLAPRAVAYLHVVPNTMRIFNSLTCVDDFALARPCDVFGGTTLSGAVFPTQLVSAGNGRTVYNVECHINAGQTSCHPKMITIDDMRRELVPQIGAGIRGFLFWQFRPESLGRESPAWGMIKPDGTDRPMTEAARVFWKTIAPHAQRLMESLPTPAEVAILKSRRNEIFHFASQNTLTPLADDMDAYTDTLYWSSYPLRYIDGEMLERGETTGLKLLIVPSCYYLTRPEADALDRFIRNGGTALVEAHCAGYDGTSGRHSQTMPGAGLAKRWGIREIDSTASIHLPKSFAGGSIGDLADDVKKALAEIGTKGGTYFPITLTGGTILAGAERYSELGGNDITIEGTYEGKPIIVSKTLGSGAVFYCGTNPGTGASRMPGGFRKLLSLVCTRARIAPILKAATPEPDVLHVDAIGGMDDSPEYIVLTNRSAQVQKVSLTGNGTYRGLFSPDETFSLGYDTLSVPASSAEIFERTDDRGERVI